MELIKYINDYKIYAKRDKANYMMLIIKKDIKAMRYRSTPIEMAEMWNTDNRVAGHHMQQQEVSATAGRNAK